MNLDQFFAHWQITENPFRGEEARHDAVFARMARLNGPMTALPRIGDAHNNAGQGVTATHADFEKIVGSLDRLSTAVVFGEKGSGKTAIRLQITRQVIAHNAANPTRKIFLIAYDDLNAFLDRLHKRLGHKDPAQSLDKIRLVDHIDALLSIGVGSLSAMVQGGASDTRRMARRLPVSLKQDWLLLDAVYGSDDGGRSADDIGEGTARAGRDGLGGGSGAGKSGLRRALRVGPPRTQIMAWALTLVGWLPAATALHFGGFGSLREAGPLLEGEIAIVFQWLGLALTILWLMPMARWQVWDRLRTNRVGRRLRKQIRVLDRSDAEYGSALRSLPRSTWDGTQLPLTETDETRYAMLARFTRVVRGLGYRGVMVLVDRVDEPTLVSGDPRRMKSVVWPMLNNKFLQQDGFALKMLLPIELRYELFRESSAFFQEARLDKQNLVERLSWTGAMLYDLCDARLNACRGRDGETERRRDEVGEEGIGDQASGTGEEGKGRSDRAPCASRGSSSGGDGTSDEGGEEGIGDQASGSGEEGRSDGQEGNARTTGENGVTLLDLFESDVALRDLVDALDQMHQPRDAFKFLYQCIAEHCSNVTAEEGQWRVPRLVLEMVRKQQSERVQALQRGIRPA